MKILRLACLFAATLAFVSLGRTADSSGPTKRALLVGIDKYLYHPPLRGAERDVELMEGVLRGRFGFTQVRKLTGVYATGAAIRLELAELARRARAGDVVVVYFSGYGAQLPDRRGSELDGLDETLVPYDGQSGGIGEIVDDDLSERIEAIAALTPNVTLVIDACFVTHTDRGGASDRCIDRGLRGEANAKLLMKGGQGGERSGFTLLPNRRYTLLSAAATDESANEVVLGTGPNGVFTYELASALVAMPGEMKWQDVFQRVSSRVRGRFPTQGPTLETPSATAPVFNDATARPEFVGIVQSSDPKEVSFSAGLFHGIANGKRVPVYAPGTFAFSGASPIATLEVMHAAPFTSVARPIGGKVPPDSVVRLAALDLGTRVSVWFDVENAPKSDLPKLKEYMRKVREVVVVEERGEAQLQVVSRDDGYAVLAGDLTPLDHGLPSGDQVMRSVQRWVRWFSVLRLSNPTSPLRLQMTLRRQGSSDPLAGPVRPGEVLAYTVTNASQSPVLFQALFMSSDGTVELGKQAEQLGPGETKEELIGTFLADDRRGITDYIKVIATSRNVDLTPLATPERAFTSSMLADVDWTVEQVSYELRRQDTRVSSFAVHVDVRGRSGAEVPPFSRQSVCRPGAARNCVVGQALTGDGSLLVVDTTFARSSLDEMSTGDAFQQAYDMRAELGAARVEPLFEVAVGEDLPGLEGRSGGSAPNDSAAAGDNLWSLKYVKVPEALATLRTALGRNPGFEAQGVRIAHLDTGYRNHPEVFSKARDYVTVLPDSGLDLVDGGDPYDTLSTSGMLPNPGHGTASGSVIVSPAGCQLGGFPEPCVSGVAPGAQLVPVRVHTSVVVLNQRRLSEAIFSVAEGRVKDSPRIISIAMGGPPSWSLWRAVRRAESKGILIIAAAGNNVGIVVWPARFASTIAVGAVNVRCKPWSGSSRGARVDISAPGESVWRAQVEQKKDVIGMGSGTTFATATTTGAAALWVARHADEPVFQRLVETGGVTAAFRRAARASAWRPVAGDANRPVTHCADGAGWDAAQNGAGILDAARLLQEPIDAASARSTEGATLESLPLFVTLYPPDTAPDRATSDYVAIFGSAARDDSAIFEAEIMHHYATNEVVRGAIDRVVEGARSPVDFNRVRGALLRVDLSRSLRERLQAARGSKS